MHVCMLCVPPHVNGIKGVLSLGAVYLQLHEITLGGCDYCG